ncbi:arsenate reductase [Verrucomicrobium sp. GAS474]|uniref:arsenate reductase family protein n=1 Tax=Verrucomicrobium sp. GAS474 TaxID=1882831 RepID=UPI00087A9E72|nr:arsenate reductase family protein [Verrucomicrobium sp. GAS474]SDU21873.1 arsenate reductase [Verrucomicrobium sp. GAS474]
MLKIYTYSGCDTCRKALKFLTSRGIAHTNIPIRETPPSKAELQAMLKEYGGDRRKLFNTSGQDYRALGLGEKFPAMSEAEAIALLGSNGNLVKRPFLIGKDILRVGFKEEEWGAVLG